MVTRGKINQLGMRALTESGNLTSDRHLAAPSSVNSGLRSKGSFCSERNIVHPLKNSARAV